MTKTFPIGRQNDAVANPIPADKHANKVSTGTQS
ncbi:MAG: hypothetical protein JWP92_297 [Caulobacter sp.]|nr:hypothetical protein [Caulobacter sp.]